MMQANNPFAGQIGSGGLWNCSCADPSQCSSMSCPRRQSWQQGLGQHIGVDAWRRAFERQSVPTVWTAPEIDYERLADLIAERLQRPKGYQG